jgi:hypothetical protein
LFRQWCTHALPASCSNYNCVSICLHPKKETPSQGRGFNRYLTNYLINFFVNKALFSELSTSV